MVSRSGPPGGGDENDKGVELKQQVEEESAEGDELEQQVEEGSPEGDVDIVARSKRNPAARVPVGKKPQKATVPVKKPEPKPAGKTFEPGEEEKKKKDDKQKFYTKSSLALSPIEWLKKHQSTEALQKLFWPIKKLGQGWEKLNQKIKQKYDESKSKRALGGQPPSDGGDVSLEKSQPGPEAGAGPEIELRRRASNVAGHAESLSASAGQAGNQNALLPSGNVEREEPVPQDAAEAQENFDDEIGPDGDEERPEGQPPKSPRPAPRGGGADPRNPF